MGNDYSLDKVSFSPKTDLPGGIVYKKNGWYDTCNQYEMGDCPLLIGHSLPCHTLSCPDYFFFKYQNSDLDACL